MADSTGTTGTTTGATSTVGQQTGTESSLSSWAGPYVTNMLGQGAALAAQPYQAYTGPLTAGPSALQEQAWQGISGLQIPTTEQSTYTPGSYTDAGVAQKYMNPYLQASLEPQLAEARRQAEITRMQNASRLASAGAFGGSRQAIERSEAARNQMQRMGDIEAQGLQQAYGQGMQQFSTEQGQALQGDPQ